jgi:subtilisin family serine protease
MEVQMNARSVGVSRLSSLVAAAVLAAGCAEETVAPHPASVPPPSLATIAAEGGELRDHMLVLRQEGAPSAALLREIEALGGAVVHRHDEIGVLSVRGLDEGATDRLYTVAEVDGIGRDFDVQWVPPAGDFQVVQLTEGGSETDQSGAFFFDLLQWNLRQIQADDAWLVTPQGQGALVCVLDTGVDPNHIDLAGKINFAKSISVFPDEPDILDRNFHGTFASALITSNGIGMASVAPDAELCIVKIAGAGGSSPFEVVIDGIMYAALIGADVLNFSFGVLAPIEVVQLPIIQATQRAISFAVKRGVLPVMSAGNEAVKIDFGSPVIHLPSGLKGAVSVGATGPIDQMNFDRLASYTNYGRKGVDIMAPGGDFAGNPLDLVWSACSNIALPDFCPGPNFYVASTGTSWSAPHVAGAGAVVESTIPGNQGSSHLRQCLFEGADEIDGRSLSFFYGRGRLNVLQSVGLKGCGGAVPLIVEDEEE